MGINVQLVRYKDGVYLGEVPEWDSFRYSGDTEFFVYLEEHGSEKLQVNEIDYVFRPVRGVKEAALQWGREHYPDNIDRWELVFTLLDKYPDAWIKWSW